MASISDILLAQGRHASESRRSRAGAWVPFAQYLASIPGQVMQDRQAERAGQEAAYDRQQQRDVRSQQLAKGDQELATAEATAEQKRQMNELLSMPGIIGEDGRFDVQTAQRTAAEKGYRDIVDDVLAFGQDWNAGVEKGLLTQEQIAAAKRSHQPQPKSLIQRDPARDLVDPVTGEVKSAGTPEVKMREVVVKGPGGRQIKKLVPESELMQGVEQYEAPREGSQPSYQAKEVLGDDGKPVMATFDPRTRAWQDPSGKRIANPRPVPSAMETQDARKFKQAAPILSSVSELSEKINTQQGLIAKISGAAEKAKAQANYNDDVAEYEALISGFTPLVARALGHTGVLTQQDVDSVKALFPKPGDSKSLRDRKIARIKSIIGELEADASGAPAATDQPPPGTGGGAPTYQDYLRSRGQR